jgi:hypothetical protein
MVRLPNSASLIEVLKPRVKHRNFQISAAQVTEFRYNFKTRVAHDISHYASFQSNLKKAEQVSGMYAEENMWLLVRKYEEATI